MSNNEILDNIFNNVSKKMIDEYVKEISISYKNNRYHYSNNLDIEILRKSLIENINNVSDKILKSLEIKDKNSLKIILNERYESDDFKEGIKKISIIFISEKKLSSNELIVIYKDHLKYYLMSGNITEKILALASENDFKDWIKRRWKIISCGYTLVLLVFLITYYVFINKDE